MSLLYSSIYKKRMSFGAEKIYGKFVLHVKKKNKCRTDKYFKKFEPKSQKFW